MGKMGIATHGHELARLRTAVELREREAEDKNRQLERYAADLRETFIEERARTRELQSSYVATVRALTNAVEARDAYTAKHAERVTAYGLELARRVAPELADDPQVEFGFLLHDIGKVAVPDEILHKRQPLSPEERELVERHPVTGSEILFHIDYLNEAKQVIRHHHERWDGGGYPDRLRGEEIPMAARIFAVADALDAITTARPYRAAASFTEARAEIAEGAGRQFDPDVVEGLEGIPDTELESIRSTIA